MRTILLAAIIPAVLARWNPLLCNGAGGCTSIGGNRVFYDPWRCPDGSAETISVFAGDLQKTGSEGATVVSHEEFPKTCFDGRYPKVTDKLVKTKSSNNQTIYAWLISECKETKPAAPGNCYNFNTNPTTYNFCAMFDASGGKCEMYRKAGFCERWGYSTVNPQCKFWKQGLPDLPDPERESNGLP